MRNLIGYLRPVKILVQYSSVHARMKLNLLSLTVDFLVEGSSVARVTLMILDHFKEVSGVSLATSN